MKAQSAIEYLMTYGWMLLVVAIAGGGVYSVVGDQCTETSSGFTGTDIGVETFGFSQDNDLELVLHNSASDEVTVNSVEVAGVQNETSQSVSVGDSEVFNVPDFIESDSCNTLNIRVNYDSGGLSDLNVEGTITAQYETGEIGEPAISSVQQ